MPKVIENLQETLISKAKSILLTKGYDALTIRGVAKAASGRYGMEDVLG